jgi:cobalt transporter subunit CbtB
MLDTPSEGRHGGLMSSISQNTLPVAVAAKETARWPALVALALGLAVVAGAGLAAPSAIHNSTHDTRHAFGLPCH